MSGRTILITVLALVFGASAAVGVNLLVQQNQTPPGTVPIVVAAVDVPRGGVLTAAQVKMVDCPADLVSPGALTKMEDAVGRLVFHELVKDEPVSERKLGAKNDRGGLAGLIPKGMRAFTIVTPNVASGVAGFVLPGNKVDVLLTMSGDEKAGGGLTITLLQNIEILAVDQRLDAPSEHKVDPRNLQSVTLLVTPEQAAVLDLGQNRGTLHLSLRNPDDAAATNTRPATMSGLRPDDGLTSPQLSQPAPTSQAAPALEIRTLRGKYYGLVPIEPSQTGAPKR